jgi:DNA polymerase III subunit beta
VFKRTSFTLQEKTKQMEIVVRTTDFARVLRLIQALADRKNTIPVLGTLLIRADAKGVSITGTGLELGGVSYCPATVKTPGSLAVPAHRLSEYVRMLPEGDLVLKEQSSGWVSLACGRSRSRIATVSAASYPEMPKPAREGPSISGGVLARLIEKVLLAASLESTNTILGGALLKVQKSTLTMVATDGHRLALTTAPVELPDLEKPIEILIPRKTLTAFLRFVEGRNDQSVRCTVTDNHLFFVWQERLLFSRKLSGVFPNYERVLPKTHTASVALSRDEFRGSIERVAQFAETKSRCVVVEVSANQLIVRAKDSAIGESEESLPVTYSGEPARIGFNVCYLADFLSRAEQKDIRLLFSNADAATEWQPVTAAAAPDFRYVVMPMRVD